MSRSRFWFVERDIDRAHLERAFSLIAELLTLSESKKYQTNEELVSSFRKTIIILTASIIEVLLMLMLQKEKDAHACGETRDEIKTTLYEISEHERIAVVQKKFIPANFAKMNLDLLVKQCKTHKIISKELGSTIDQVRILRNRQHLGSLQELEVFYTKADLDLVFSVAKEVTEQAETALTF